jgi:hypothetical protein
MRDRTRALFRFAEHCPWPHAMQKIIKRRIFKWRMYHHLKAASRAVALNEIREKISSSSSKKKKK